MLERIQRKQHTEITFIVPADHSYGPVSVVGDFNDWRPGVHPLVERPDGCRAVTVKLPSSQRHQFRYLAHGDHWFNEENADGHEGRRP
ncbi:isoamylase early set domain-containing protein [Streptomyces chattanoogensis]|uniref:isoamylase early set domain-containing protein n=1 Tax=Streptomyces chattanoogensis TaxID=66876 RepID=UPI00369B328E